MKKLFFITIILLFLGVSCSDNTITYKVDTSDIPVKANIDNFSEKWYNTSVPFDSIKKKYPFFLDNNIPKETFLKRRTDTLELLIYNEIKTKIDLDSIPLKLTQLFKHIKYYYPKFTAPKVYTFSSAFDESFKFEPIKYYKEENLIFIALDYFIGEKNEFFKSFKIDNYLQKAMNPNNITPRVSYAIAETIPLMDVQNNQFLNLLLTHGKVMLLQDAFLPNYPDNLKINYTSKEINWCYANEKNMWNYFIQEDYLFSDDKKLITRFLASGPFSKFYTMDEDNNSVDLKSPGGVGKWIGWQILRKYRKENPSIKLQEIMANRNSQLLFKQSHYQP